MSRGAGLVAALACALGCGRSTPPLMRPAAPPDLTGWPEGGTVVAFRAHTATLWPGASADEIAAVASALRFWVTAWEADERRALPPTRFGVLHDVVPAIDGSAKCWTYRGRWCGGPYVLLAATPDLTCPATGHELYHRAYGLEDHEHPSPDAWWNWDQRQAQFLGYLEQTRAAR